MSTAKGTPGASHAERVHAKYSRKRQQYMAAAVRMYDNLLHGDIRRDSLVREEIAEGLAMVTGLDYFEASEWLADTLATRAANRLGGLDQ